MLEKKPGIIPGPLSFQLRANLVVHTAHATHATTRHGRSATVLLRSFGDHSFCGDQKPGDRRRILQRRSNNLSRVNDPLGDEIYVFSPLGVEAKVILTRFQDLADDDRAVLGRADAALEPTSTSSRGQKRLRSSVAMGAKRTSSKQANIANDPCDIECRIRPTGLSHRARAD